MAPTDFDRLRRNYEASTRKLQAVRSERDALAKEVDVLKQERDQARETTRCYLEGAKKLHDEMERLKKELEERPTVEELSMAARKANR